jgi:uncharacterized membrane-anchored protein
MKLEPARIIRLAVLIPVVGLAVLVIRAEMVHTGQTWRLPIEGFDPRDPLHGHYLQYRYRFMPDLVDISEPGTASCVCLSRTNEEGFDPPARGVPCDLAHTCDAWLDTDTVRGPQRFYIPEAAGPALEQALRDRPASVVVTIDANGAAIPSELFIDDRPWRERVP